MNHREMPIRTVTQNDSAFPPLLREIPDPPRALFLKGVLPPSPAVAVAIVGTRRATPDGKRLAREFAMALAQHDITIVSGLAFGIDAAAHAGCLEVGGKTVAVLAGGLDRVYPRSNENLAQQILASDGGLVSEYAPGTDPLPYRFLERNRIVSGMSQGVVVIECPEGSGSLATARFAAEQGRSAFVIPGPISHPNFRGSHELIRKGAELVTKPEDVLEALGIAFESEKMAVDSGNFTDEERAIVNALQTAKIPLDVDKIAELSKLQPRIVNQTITVLLLKNVIKEEGLGYGLR